jgi:AAA domain
MKRETKTVAQSRNGSVTLPDQKRDTQNIDQGPDGSEPLPTEKPAAIVKPLMDLEPANENDGNTLLGNRFLCPGAGLLFVGHTGVGKSTAVVQMGISWAVGRQCFGIAPKRPLRILYIQAENDEGDLCEMRGGVLEHLQLSKKEEAMLRKNFVCVFEGSRMSDEFFSETVGPLLQKYSPDLLIIDPALSYIGGDANAQEVVGIFLRNLLNPLLQKHNCGAVVVHHTAKPTAAKNGAQSVATDYAYLGAGSAEWANWPRAVLVLKAKDQLGVRELRIGKRFRLDWKDPMGEPSASRFLRQNSTATGIFYTELSDEETLALTGKVSKSEKVQKLILSQEPGKTVEKKLLIARIASQGICGENKVRDAVKLLISDGYLEEFDKPRTTGPPEVWVRRTDKKPNRVSFTGGKPLPDPYGWL